MAVSGGCYSFTVQFLFICIYLFFVFIAEIDFEITNLLEILEI